MSVTLMLQRYALICLVFFIAPSFAQLPVPYNADCVDREGQNPFYLNDPKHINPIRNGLQDPRPFFLKNGYDWEKWRPNADRQVLANGLQVQPLPADLVEAYLNGSAGVYPSIKMWKIDAPESQPFVLFGGKFSRHHCILVSFDSQKVIGIGGTIMSFYYVGAGDEYPTRDGRIQPVLRNEAMLYVGRTGEPLPGDKSPARYLLLKRIQSTPCILDKNLRPALMDGAEQLCKLHRASAKLIEHNLDISEGKTTHREQELGEIYVREIHGQKSWDMKLFPKEDSFIEKILSRIIQFGLNR